MFPSSCNVGSECWQSVTVHTAARSAQIHVFPGTLIRQLARALTALGRALKCFLLVSHMVVHSRKVPAIHLSVHT